MKLWPFSMERRAEPRREVRLEVSFVVRDEFSGNLLTTPQPATLQDISLHGCCLALDRLDCGGFHLHRCLEDPQDFPLELRLASQAEEDLAVQGEVRWVNREMGAEGRPFRVGLQLRKEGQVVPLAWRRLNQ